jgi:murein DD-endopeptidase MepM/ murein hydrolase activator NlpD
MASIPAVLKRTALAVGALLVVAAAVSYGSRKEPSTQIVPVVLPADAPASSPLTAATQAFPAAQAGQLPAVVENAAPPTAPSSSMGATDDADIAQLRLRALMLPVQGLAVAQLTDTYTQARAAGAPHEALDIMAARGTPVMAVEDGKVAKLFLSKPGGITIYQFDPGSSYAYYYAHLDRYADGLAEGASLRKGEVIGYVGSTGNASPDAPHLHFAIFKLGPERQWWRGTPLNPYLVWRDARP